MYGMRPESPNAEIEEAIIETNSPNMSGATKATSSSIPYHGKIVHKPPRGMIALFLSRQCLRCDIAHRAESFQGATYCPITQRGIVVLKVSC